MAKSSKCNGSLVAFEGRAAVVSTQLRLLPTSPHILVLPSVQSYLKDDAEPDSFDARSFVCKVHEAASTRTAVALQFLQEPYVQGRRLVFLNGGAASAQALCIGTIQEKQTGGDFDMAKAAYNSLVREGVAALARAGEPKSSKASPAPSPGTMQARSDEKGYAVDPAKRAMQAADALYKQTACLEPEDEYDYRPLKMRPRSMSLPNHGYVNPSRDADPLYLLDNSPHDEESCDQADEIDGDETTFVGSPGEVRTTDEMRPRTTSRASETFGAPRSPSCATEAYEPRSPSSVSRTSAPSPEPELPNSPAAAPTPSEPVTYGKARMIEVRSSISARDLRQSRSLDRFRARSGAGWSSVASSAAHYDNPRDEIPILDKLQSPASIRSAGRKVHPRPVVSRLDLASSVLLSKADQQALEQSFADAKQWRIPARLTYIDRGTDAGNFNTSSSSAEELKARSDVPFEPVLPLVEDLVIHLTNEGSDEPLDLMIRGLREGRYPIQAQAAFGSEPDETLAILKTPTRRDASVRVAPPPVHGTLQPNGDSDEYDPFASHGEYEHDAGQWPQKSSSSQMTAVPADQKPPTPARTPSPSLPDSEQRFYTFSIPRHQTAVSVQNGLRTVLNGYFPPEAEGYHPFQFPLLEDMDGLWRPVFGEAEPSSPEQEGGSVDLILAVGSEKSVKRDYLSALTGQIEKLGSKSSGISRSGRLDLRYLIANAMQTFTSQAYINQTVDNPFTNPMLLATLIVPHLETYLAANSCIKFLLLEYTAEQLSTVLALQKLVGKDLVKIAGIIDSEGGSVSPATHEKTPSHGSSGSVHSSASSSRRPSFSRANFLLTSAATDAEIAAFASTIWKLLIDASQFYAPEPSPKQATPKTSPRRPPPPPLPLSIYNQNAKAMAYRAGSVASEPTSPPPSPSPDQAATPKPARPVSPAPSNRSRVSTAGTVRTARTGRSTTDRLRSLKGGHSKDRVFLDLGAAQTPKGSSLFEVDMDDSDFEADERRLMPMYMRATGPRKGNSRKALKWLGLA